jgi:hypothetical protein
LPVTTQSTSGLWRWKHLLLLDQRRTACGILELGGHYGVVRRRRQPVEGQHVEGARHPDVEDENLALDADIVFRLALAAREQDGGKQGGNKHEPLHCDVSLRFFL